MKESILKTFYETWVDPATGKTAADLADALAEMTGTPSADPPSGALRHFNDAVLGYEVKDDIIRLTMLLMGYFVRKKDEVDETAGDVSDMKDDVSDMKDAVEALKEEIEEEIGQYASVGVIDGSTDLDDLDATCLWQESGSHSVSHLPSSLTGTPCYILHLEYADGYAEQIAFAADLSQCWRRGRASSWDSSWTRIGSRATSYNLISPEEAAESGADMLRALNKASTVYAGIHYVRAANGHWKIYGGTPSSSVAFAFLKADDPPAGLPGWLQAGKTYTVTVDSTDRYGADGGDDIYLRVTRYFDAEPGQAAIDYKYFNRGTKPLELPSNCIGADIEIMVKAGTQLGATKDAASDLYVSMRGAKTNAELEALLPVTVDENGLHLHTDVFLNNDVPVFRQRAQLTAADDLDSVTTPGMYFMGVGRMPANAPSVHSAYLLVFGNAAATNCVQLVFTKRNHAYFRSKLADTQSAYYGTTGFSDWVRFAEAKAMEIPSATFIRGENGRDIPQNSGVMASYKRAHQLTDLRYETLDITPSAVTPEGGDPVETRAAGQYTGAPYSSVKECEAYVGTDVSFLTFLSAVNNPYSLFYTECVRGGTYTYNNHTYTDGKSAYGLSYHGVNNVGPYYGCVCSQFMDYVLGQRIRFVSSEFGYLTDQGLLYKVTDNSHTGIQLMDVIQEYRASGKPSHETVVTDIYRNERGVPTRIFVSECASGQEYVKDGVVVPAGTQDSVPTVGCRTREYDAAGFDAYLREGVSGRSVRGQLYRFVKIADYLDYTPSDFVAVEDEPEPEPYAFNDDICTYAGDWASFRLGFPVHVNYTRGAYTHMALKKNGTVIATVALPSSYNATHSVDLSEYCQSAGLYSAYLTDGTAESRPTYFEVINASVAAEGTFGNLTVSFNGDADPLYVELTTSGFGRLGVLELSARQIAAGAVTFNAVDLVRADSGARLGATCKVRVKYRGEYGNVVSAPLTVDTDSEDEEEDPDD